MSHFVDNYWAEYVRDVLQISRFVGLYIYYIYIYISIYMIDAAFFWFATITLVSHFVDNYWADYVRDVLQISRFIYIYIYI